jgi:hypothetical protein
MSPPLDRAPASTGAEPHPTRPHQTAYRGVCWISRGVRLSLCREMGQGKGRLETDVRIVRVLV